LIDCLIELNVPNVQEPKPVESGMRMNSNLTNGSSIWSGSGTTARSFSGSVR
jgi:hypothetical protein